MIRPIIYNLKRFIIMEYLVGLVVIHGDLEIDHFRVLRLRCPFIIQPRLKKKL